MTTHGIIEETPSNHDVVCNDASKTMDEKFSRPIENSSSLLCSSSTHCKNAQENLAFKLENVEDEKLVPSSKWFSINCERNGSSGTAAAVAADWTQTDTPKSLIGRKIEVLSVVEDMHMSGTIISFNEQTGKHKIYYDTKTMGDLSLPDEKIKVLSEVDNIDNNLKNSNNNSNKRVSSSPVKSSLSTDPWGEYDAQTRLDLMKSFVGREIEVYSPDDEAYLHGNIISFDERSGKHRIYYDNKTMIELQLKDEKIRLLDVHNNNNMLHGFNSPTTSSGNLKSSNYVGVQNAGESKWIATAPLVEEDNIMNREYIGTFTTERDAALAHDAYARRRGHTVNFQQEKINVREVHRRKASCLEASSSTRHNRGGQYRGVYWLKKRNRWIARYTKRTSGKHFKVGEFANAKHAAYAFDAMARKQYLPKKYLNFPNERPSLEEIANWSINHSFRVGRPMQAKFKGVISRRDANGTTSFHAQVDTLKVVTGLGKTSGPVSLGVFSYEEQAALEYDRVCRKYGICESDLNFPRNVKLKKLRLFDNECYFCQMEGPNDAVAIPCNHVFCRSCIMSFLEKKSECPCCQMVVTTDEKFRSVNLIPWPTSSNKNDITGSPGHTGNRKSNCQIDKRDKGGVCNDPRITGDMSLDSNNDSHEKEIQEAFVQSRNDCIDQSNGDKEEDDGLGENNDNINADEKEKSTKDENETKEDPEKNYVKDYIHEDLKADSKNDNNDEVKSYQSDIEIQQDLTAPTNTNEIDADDVDNTSDKEENETSEEEEEEGNAIRKTVLPAFGVGTVVNVTARTGKGSNKPGGVGRVKRAYVEDGKALYDIRYVLGGSERRVALKYITLHDLDRVMTERDRQLGHGLDSPSTRKSTPVVSSIQPVEKSVDGSISDETDEVSVDDKDISTPSPNDVLCLQGRQQSQNPGNIKYRNLIHEYAIEEPCHDSASLIVDTIQSQNPPGRFLEFNKSTQLWNSISDERAKNKTIHALHNHRYRKIPSARREAEKDDKASMMWEDNKSFRTGRKTKTSSESTDYNTRKKSTSKRLTVENPFYDSEEESQKNDAGLSDYKTSRRKSPEKKLTVKNPFYDSEEDDNENNVARPEEDVIEWHEELSTIEQRSNIQIGHRVKVRFGEEGWFGGVVAKVMNKGWNIRINYDDGTSEVSSFPDTDIVVDDKLNGKHNVDAGTFLPPSRRRPSFTEPEIRTTSGRVRKRPDFFQSISDDEGIEVSETDLMVDSYEDNNGLPKVGRTRRKPSFFQSFSDDENSKLVTSKQSVKKQKVVYELEHISNKRNRTRSDSFSFSPGDEKELISSPTKSRRGGQGRQKNRGGSDNRNDNGDASIERKTTATEVWSGFPDDKLEGGWPRGWKKKLFRRKPMGRKDPYWYSPKLGKRFRSMREVKIFLEILSETSGDEAKAWDVFSSGR